MECVFVKAADMPPGTLRKSDSSQILSCDFCKMFWNSYFFHFHQGFLIQSLTTHRTAGEAMGPSFYSYLPLPPSHEYSGSYLQIWI